MVTFDSLIFVVISEKWCVCLLDVASSWLGWNHDEVNQGKSLCIVSFFFIFWYSCFRFQRIGFLWFWLILTKLVIPIVLCISDYLFTMFWFSVALLIWVNFVFPLNLVLGLIELTVSGNRLTQFVNRLTTGKTRVFAFLMSSSRFVKF